MIAARRFWTGVTVTPEAGGFGVWLDERPLRTPAQAALLVPTRAFAEAIAAEWRAVEVEIRPEDLPFTRAANVAIDRVALDLDGVADAISAYGESDLLCYRAEAPEGLRRRQAEGWDPPLAWAAEALGAPLDVTFGFVHVTQPRASLTALRSAVGAQNPFALTALYDLVTLSGSLVLGLGVLFHAVSPKDAWALSRIDEVWQSEQWGVDDDAEAAASLKRDDFLRSAILLEMLADCAAFAQKA